MRRPMVIALTAALLIIISVISFASRNSVFVLRQVFLAQLKAPDTAVFRNERIFQSDWLCGEVSAKGLLGTGSDFRKFIVGINGEAYIEGVGYVGQVNGNSWAVKEERSIRGHISRAEKEGTVPIHSAERVEELVRMELFSRRWSQVCHERDEQ